jgi:hypothetical protein
MMINDLSRTPIKENITSVTRKTRNIITETVRISTVILLLLTMLTAIDKDPVIDKRIKQLVTKSILLLPK